MKILGIVILAGLFVACGSDGDDGGGGGSGVPSSKRVSDLTQDEATALCTAHQADFDAIAIGGCRLALAAVAADQCATCDSTPSVDCSGTDTSNVAGCTVTVGEMESCLTQMADALEGVTCEASQTAPNIPACAEAIQTTCASLFGGGAPSGDGGV